MQRLKINSSNLEYKELLAIFEGIDEPIYISDPNTYEIIYINKKLRETIGDIVGKKCFRALQGLDSPCSFCSNKFIFGKNLGKVYTWDFKNKLNKHWYHCIDRAIRWPDGRWLRCEIAIDINERKKKEERYKRLNEKLKRLNSQLKSLILKDTLTGLYNHRYLEERIESEFQYAKRFNRSLAVIFIDLDYFKSINEMYGHKFGDKILKQFASKVKNIIRKYDLLVRFSGEEFVVLCKETDKVGAVNLANRLLEEINLVRFGDKKEKIKLSLSMGVASYPENKINKGIELVNLAEKLVDKAKDKGGNCVLTDEARSLDNLDQTAASAISYPRIFTLKKKLVKLVRQTRRTVTETILAFAKTIELKDHYTGEHVEKTVYYATKIAEALGLSEKDKELVKQAAILHDLGKIGISEKILLKRGKLSPEEFEEVKKHPRIGADILRPIEFLNELIPLIYYHHERWDGKGYLTGLKGEEIPLGARIIALADVYQALISDRPYRKAYSQREAIKIIKDNSGTQFDPQVVEAFLSVVKEDSV